MSRTYPEVVFDGECSQVSSPLSVQQPKQVLQRLQERPDYTQSEESTAEQVYLGLPSMLHSQNKVKICLVILQTHSTS